MRLPNPGRERWQPLRSGFVNLYRYDREEFHYENGRLLLRGNNGTGKSRVLALQLPFLLDGEVNPERLEPDADPSKKIEWNLLMGRYPDRTGYTWIEFGRRGEVGEAGTEHYLTIGCGLSAVEGRAGVGRWFFITTQRIGKDLDLVTESRQVLGKDRLREKIGSAGQVFENAGSYRRAVNDALFHLNEYQYASLVNLLIQLRRPRLTRRLEEHELSRALSEALPPVSPGLIATVAEAFRDLESDRTRLGSSKTALAAVEQFLAGYRRYAEVAARRRADRVLAAHDEYEAAMKNILTAEAECDRFLAELAQLKAELQRLSAEKHALEAEITGFQQGSYIHDAQSVERAHYDAVEKRRDADNAQAELAEAARVRKSCSEEYLRVKALQEQRQLRLAAAIDAAAHAAISAGLEEIHRECFDSLDIEQAREKIASAVRAQMEKVEHALSLNERVASAKTEFHRASAEREQLSGLIDDAREHLNAARAEHQASITSFLGAASEWTADLTELPLPFDESFLRSVGEWCDRPHGPNPFAIASRKALNELTIHFCETRAYLKELEKTLEAEPGDPERLDHLIDSIDELNRREGVLQSEADATPPDEHVRTAYDYSVAVSRHLDSLRNRVDGADEYVSQKQSQVDRVTGLRDRAVEDLGIAKWVDDLEALKDGIVRYRVELSSLLPAVEAFQESRTAREWAWNYLEQTTSREARQKDIANVLERRAVASEIARDAAGHAVDAGVDEILKRVNQARERLESLRLEESDARQRYHDTEVAVTRVDERLRNRTDILDGETDRRETAALSLRTFASTGLLKLTACGLDGADALAWSTARTIEVAFELVSRLNSINAGDAAWESHQKSVPSDFTTLMQALSAEGCESSAAFRDDVFVATAVVGGEECGIDDLRQILAEDTAARQMLLDAQAKEILENHLIGQVSGHLRELLHTAADQVRQMNVELESRPTSTGMKLRFVWRPAELAPSGTAEVVQRLMQLDDDWSAVDRQMLGTFLQEQIQSVFSEIEGASWQESLAEALDYRKWHWFGVERYQDGVWKRLTHRTYGTGSGGEKAVALTLPHFAAAAAFYRTANPLAPRLILLDEAFVGIDADMRAKCMGLIHTFDLDFMMTSEREWGCYQTLPGVAIYHLSTRSDIDAIGLTRWVWNGRRRNLLQSMGGAEIPYEVGAGSDLVTVAAT